jgi:hypothetical protein
MYKIDNRVVNGSVIEESILSPIAGSCWFYVDQAHSLIKIIPLVPAGKTLISEPGTRAGRGWAYDRITYKVLDWSAFLALRGLPGHKEVTSLTLPVSAVTFCDPE